VLAVQAARHLIAGHHGGGMGPPPKRDGWETVRHGTVVKVACLKAGCVGCCPLAVVVRSNKADGVPAKCQVCGMVFAVPASAKDAPRGKAKGKGEGSGKDKGKGAGKPSGGVKDLQAVVSQLQAEVASLKSQRCQAAAASPPPETAVVVSAMSACDKLEAASLQKQIQQVNDMDPALRIVLCESKGGFEAFVAQLQQQRQQIFAKHRGTQPVDVQKAKCEAYHRAMQRLKEEADGQLSLLLVQQLELQASIEKQSVAVANADAKLLGACAELAAIVQQTELLAPSGLPGAGAGGDFDTQSVVTAASVRGFFQRLPGEVAAHPEGQKTIMQVMALLEKLDAAAKLAQTTIPVASGEVVAGAAGADSAPLLADEVVVEVEMSTDDLFDQFDTIVGVDVEGSTKVAELKAKLEAKLKAKKSNEQRGVAGKFAKTGK
jgi:hypothetical protein